MSSESCSLTGLQIDEGSECYAFVMAPDPHEIAESAVYRRGGALVLPPIRGIYGGRYFLTRENLGFIGIPRGTKFDLWEGEDFNADSSSYVPEIKVGKVTGGYLRTEAYDFMYTIPIDDPLPEDTTVGERCEEMATKIMQSYDEHAEAAKSNDVMTSVRAIGEVSNAIRDLTFYDYKSWLDFRIHIQKLMRNGSSKDTIERLVSYYLRGFALMCSAYQCRRRIMPSIDAPVNGLQDASFALSKFTMLTALNDQIGGSDDGTIGKGEYYKAIDSLIQELMIIRQK